jgi:hypothetical protein
MRACACSCSCACMHACVRARAPARARACVRVGGGCTRSCGGCCRLVRHSLVDWPSMQLTDPRSSMHSSLAVSSVCGLATPGRSRSRPRIVELRSALVWPCIGTPFTRTHHCFATVIFEAADNLHGRQQQNDGSGLDWGLIDSIESLWIAAVLAVVRMCLRWPGIRLLIGMIAWLGSWRLSVCTGRCIISILRLGSLNMVL